MSAEEPRPYPIPTAFQPGSRNVDLGIFDIVYVTDYSIESRFINTVLGELESAVELGLRVGYMHIHSPQTLRRTALPTRLLELQRAGKVTQISEQDRAEANLLLVYDASIGMFLDSFKSSLVVHRAVVVDDHGARLRATESRHASHPTTALDHLDRSFNTYFRIVGAARQDHEKLQYELPPERLLGSRSIWSPHIVGEFPVPKLPGQTPVIGFHSFGNQYRWPSTRRTFEDVYRVEGSDVLFYGALKPARSKLGTDIISDSQKLERNRYTVTDFLDRVDFWIYYPNDRLIDRPWLPALQAMQAGKVVILPKHLREIYGDGAVYVDPEEVAAVVREYSQDSTRYLAQAQRAQKLIDEVFSLQAYAARLNDLLKSPE